MQRLIIGHPAGVAAASGTTARALGLRLLERLRRLRPLKRLSLPRLLHSLACLLFSVFWLLFVLRLSSDQSSGPASSTLTSATADEATTCGRGNGRALVDLLVGLPSQQFAPSVNPRGFLLSDWGLAVLTQTLNYEATHRCGIHLTNCKTPSGYYQISRALSPLLCCRDCGLRPLSSLLSCMWRPSVLGMQRIPHHLALALQANPRMGKDSPRLRSRKNSWAKTLRIKLTSATRTWPHTRK